jgi:hypothetical protein
MIKYPKFEIAPIEHVFVIMHEIFAFADICTLGVCYSLFIICIFLKIIKLYNFRHKLCKTVVFDTFSMARSDYGLGSSGKTMHFCSKTYPFLIVREE